MYDHWSTRKGIRALGAAAVLALTLGLAASVSASPPQRDATWQGQGSEWLDVCADGGVYHFVLNQYGGDPAGFSVVGANELDRKVTPGVVHFYTDGPVASIAGATGFLVLSDCVPTEPPPEEPPVS